jgi:hypothetical protein
VVFSIFLFGTKSIPKLTGGQGFYAIGADLFIAKILQILCAIVGNIEAFA